MTLRSSDLQSDSDLDSLRNSCDVSFVYMIQKLGMIFILSQKFFLIGGNGFQKNHFLQGKNGQNKPENQLN